MLRCTRGLGWVLGEEKAKDSEGCDIQLPNQRAANKLGKCG